MQRNRFLNRKRELKDKDIQKALEGLPALYADGAIIETRDLCFEIVEAISEFERAYDGE